MAISPITGMLRRRLVLDLAIGLGMSFRRSRGVGAVDWVPRHLARHWRSRLTGIAGSGFVMANYFWYGFHLPRTHARDAYYGKLEEKRAQAKAN
ncbi:hypothetical protein HRG_000114 [Hirsutella rhossiliensis]|uniref:Cytochrome c oxidase polypeptide VIIA n=1 Tax=Hirsutella rhossiliensis TaxID=111463 RepID=A0A9P8N5R6_9HYPO|nr:uncharacterized protein HRG_00114 [Hirsutella rhossiliensis]KAH0967472.1 hypothetical protein HRG_00114 [Hirsutella rhossiliensis]